MLLRLEREYYENNSKENYSVLLLSEIYETLSHVYFSNRDKKKFTMYVKKLEELKNTASGLTSKEQSLLKIRWCAINSYKNLFRITDSSQCKTALDCITEAYSLSKKINNTDYIFKLANFTINALLASNSLLNLYSTAITYINEAYELSVKTNRLPEQLIFKAYLAEYNLIVNREDYNTAIYIIKDCYKKIKKTAFHSNSHFSILRIYIRTLNTDATRKKWIKVMNDSIKFFTVMCLKYDLWWQKYTCSAYKYSEKIHLLKIIKNEGANSIIIDKTNYQTIKILDNLVQTGLRSYKHILSFFITAHIYRDVLWFDFWKGKNINFDKCKYYIKLVDRMKRNKQIVNIASYSFLKTGIRIFEELKYHSAKIVYEKFAFELRTLKEEFFQSPTLIKYTYMYKIAEVLNIKELWKIIREINKRIFAHNPNAKEISDIALNSTI